jgi:flagellar biosynthetic protein FliR
MHSEAVLIVPAASLLSFAMILARVSGVIAFFPLPGLRAPVDAGRTVLALVLSVALLPSRLANMETLPPVGEIAASVISEMMFGLAAGIVAALVLEGYQIAAQTVGVQAGYGYATTTDPSSQADSGVLQAATGLAGGLFFFSLGLHRQLLRILANSWNSNHPGVWRDSGSAFAAVAQLGTQAFTSGLKLALPAVALLILIDLSVTVLGRMQQQLQMLSIAFPLKMSAGVLVMALLLPVFARMVASSAAGGLALLAGPSSK